MKSMVNTLYPPKLMYDTPHLTLYSAELWTPHWLRVFPQTLTLNNGARYSVLVQLNKTPGNYLITAAGAGINQKVAGYGTFSYIDGDPSVVGKPSIDYGGNSISTDVVVLDENTIKPLVPSRPSEQADQTYLLTIGRIEKAWKWSLNGDHSYSMSLESEKPMLWDPQSQADSDLVIATNNDTWVDIVFAVSGEPSTIQPGHPIHKHSNRVYVLVSYFKHFECKFHGMDSDFCVLRVLGRASSIGLLLQRLNRKSQRCLTWSTLQWEVWDTQLSIWVF